VKSYSNASRAKRRLTISVGLRGKWQRQQCLPVNGMMMFMRCFLPEKLRKFYSLPAPSGLIRPLRSRKMREPLLTPAEAARELRVSVKQLRLMTEAGLLPYINLGMRDRPYRRYDPAHLDKFIAGEKPELPVVASEPPEQAIQRVTCPPDAGKPGSKDSYVYFIVSDGKVKIGRARSIKARMNALQSGSPHPVHLVRYELGGAKQEKAFHKRFAAYRDRLEWFRIEGDLAAFLVGAE
jgi:hypothetical protein